MFFLAIRIRIGVRNYKKKLTLQEKSNSVMIKCNIAVWFLCLVFEFCSCEGKTHNTVVETNGMDSVTKRMTDRGTMDTMCSKISPYDHLIKKTAGEMGWDWRLLASIIYHESRFKSDLESSCGAYGPMQLMPVVMERYDVDYDSSIEEHLEAGGKLLLDLEKKMPEEISDPSERQKFVLAAYNAGLKTVLSARTQAESNGKDPNVWEDNVEPYVSKQTIHFVENVMNRFSQYKALTK